MIDITGSDIQKLNDTDLRTLIGLLCESDLQAMALSSASVTWGGDQNAPDGGIDVRVELSTVLPVEGFIPRANTGFQVKRSDMPRSSIIDEMRPKGSLRPAIMELANSGGAYIIVSSQGSCSDSVLADRRRAMKDALAESLVTSELKFDFYDRDRVAGWVRTHPSLIIWVKDKIGQPLQGWKGYANWADAPGGITEEYLQDGHLRLYSDTSTDYNRSNGTSVVEGINVLRSTLRTSGSSVRLVGLSGVGKTRLLQALFDESIGTNALDKSQVYYSDVGSIPIPEPAHFAERLISLNTPAILIIDNCSSVLHKRLTSICSATNSLVSLITVEYDVREDQPEETHIFRLEPSSNELIQSIISKRFPYISEVNARTIAKFSGGNIRIAIALSNTIKSGETLARFQDDELFNRLFQQRNEPNNNLMKAAEVCAIVYSFNIETAEGKNEELKLLGSMIGMSVNELYLNIRELQRRELIQERGVWRAVLPQAIANKLAQKALENIPLELVYNTFECEASERILKSFSRRLSYLPNSRESVMISNRWLSEDGLLNRIGNLNKLGIQLLENIAPVNPELILESIERESKRERGAKVFLSLENPHYGELTKILRSIAYNKQFFGRCCKLLIYFALSENTDENSNSIQELFRSLFFIHLSGTHATIEQRLDIIKELIESSIEKRSLLGLSLLDAALETMQFSSFHGFEFGAHSRDYGYAPQDEKDVHIWYGHCLDFTVNFSISDHPLAFKARIMLAEKFRGLWIRTHMYDELELVALKVAQERSWLEGLVAIRTILSLDKEEIPPEILIRLISLGNTIEPKDLAERVRLFSFPIKDSDLDLLDTTLGEDEQAFEQFSTRIRLLGQELAYQHEVFIELLPEIVNENSDRLFDLGQGLAEGSNDLKQMWFEFYSTLASNVNFQASIQTIRGFLNIMSIRNNKLTQQILDYAVTDEVLAPIFVQLQTSVHVNNQTVRRLKQSIQHGAVPVYQYVSISHGRYHEGISDSDFCEILRMILLKPEGFKIVIEMFGMRLHNHSDEHFLSDVMISLGRDLILKISPSRKDNNFARMDYKLSRIIRRCLIGETAEEIAEIFSKRFIEVFVNHDIEVTDYKNVLKELAIAHPKIILGTFLSINIDSARQIKKKFLYWNNMRYFPIAYIDDELILKWCEASPDTRYLILAASIIPYKNKIKEESVEWTPLALRIINRASDPIIILEEFKPTLRPMTWSGSRAELIQSRLQLLTELNMHENNSIKEWAINAESEFEKEIRSTREWELKSEMNHYDSFE